MKKLFKKKYNSVDFFGAASSVLFFYAMFNGEVELAQVSVILFCIFISVSIIFGE